MQDCCETGSEGSSCALNAACPVCGHKGYRVELKQLLLHMRNPWEKVTPSAPYFFCRQSDCEVVYFSQHAVIAEQEAMRHRVGIKERLSESIVCYCFGITRAEANAATREFVVQQTRTGLCACPVVNPSGQCCLKDFPKH